MSFVRFALIASLLCVAPAFAQAPAAAPSMAVDENSHYGWADVLRVDPVYGDSAAAAPAPPCYEEQVPVDGSAESTAQERRGIATVIGAFIGGILGNRIGKGSGRTAATVAGAVVGGVAGNRLAASDDAPERPQYTTQRHCPPSVAAAQKVVGYDVEYRYRGDVYTSRLAYDPGDRLRVRVTVTPAE
ncbi:MAG: glycine zipper 2TM domain-containing protein [Rudaea sp.]